MRSWHTGVHVRPLQEQLLSIMDTKDHWAWVHFTQPGLRPAQLLAHFRHEYQVYVRDFPVLLGRLLGQGPPDSVRAALAENIYEEETGGLSLGVSHPELFREMMAGLGISREALESENPPLEPEARAYRTFLDQISQQPPWQVAAAVLTIFVEGSRHERAVLAGTHTSLPVDEAIAAHPLVKHYGLTPDHMRLVRAHRAVEGDHRDDAWSMVLDHVEDGSPLATLVVDAVQKARDLWSAYRDGVVRAGNTQGPS